MKTIWSACARAYLVPLKLAVNRAPGLVGTHERAKLSLSIRLRACGSKGLCVSVLAKWWDRLLSSGVRDSTQILQNIRARFMGSWARFRAIIGLFKVIACVRVTLVLVHEHPRAQSPIINYRQFYHPLRFTKQLRSIYSICMILCALLCM